MNHRDLFEELHRMKRVEPIAVDAPVSGINLRPYQREAVDCTFNEWSKGTRSVLVQLPTGCGKSVVFSEIMRRCASS